MSRMIRSGPKHRVTVQLMVSKKELEIVLQPQNSERARATDALLRSIKKGVLTPDPVADDGVVSLLNDALSCGFLLLGKERGIDIRHEDLWFHPYRYSVPVIETLELSYVLCETRSPFVRFSQPPLLDNPKQRPKERERKDNRKESGRRRPKPVKAKG